jgi:hypothetical protein
MRPLIPALLLMLSSLSLSAQKPMPRIVCGNDIFSSVVREKYPDLHDAFNQTFENARLNKGVQQRQQLNIRVVVHVVWKDAVENLDDSIILNQIQVLNNDYNRLNSDTANLRPLFQPVAGNADIHFELAAIERVKTTKLFEVDAISGDFASIVKHTAQGGSDAWDTDHYLNIWVCQIQPLTIFGIPIGQILGFAFPPNGLAHWPAGSAAPQPDEDGVVIDFRVFGSNNPNEIDNPDGSGPIDVNGRTPVHEVGHYLGLRHIWGDGGTFGPNNCDQSDGVDDTPYANTQSAFDCDTTKNTCEQVEMFYNVDMPDLIENYMDYSSETCMNMFTKGQVEIMHAVLGGPRSGLLDPVSGTKDVRNDLNVSIFPNPANDLVTLQVGLSEASDIRVSLVGVDGRVARAFAPVYASVGTQTIKMNTGDLPMGLYLMQVQTEKGMVVRKLEVAR